MLSPVLLRIAIGMSMADHLADLDRWLEHGFISPEQRDRILEFESSRTVQAVVDGGPGRLANAVSTVGAGVAIAATAGIVALFAGDWSSGEALIAALIAAAIMISAAWQLVRNGWGAPAGLLAICGLVLIPIALNLGADAAGWWPEDDIGRQWEQVERERERATGIVLLLAILPGMLTTWLGLRQAWLGLPIALWFGLALLVDNPFDNVTLGIVQVFFGVAVAAFAAFYWQPGATSRHSAWWLQAGGLILAAQAAALSAFEHGPGFALLGTLAAIGIFIVGAARGRTPWMVAGALASVLPVGSLIFEYFDGLAGLIVVAMVGLAVAFLPLVYLRRRVTARSL